MGMVFGLWKSTILGSRALLATVIAQFGAVSAMQNSVVFAPFATSSVKTPTNSCAARLSRDQEASQQGSGSAQQGSGSVPAVRCVSVQQGPESAQQDVLDTALQNVRGGVGNKK